MKIKTKNYPSWDAKAWLDEFEASKQIPGGTRPVRAKVFQSTLQIVTNGGYQTLASLYDSITFIMVKHYKTMSFVNERSH